ncbi:MAG: SDR family NAD(P)-dependent oxidoreductase [Methanomassiliicoccaceae archaeon]|nr:SDR family NAD(P)-dependent oxidoreductase [Methanomassiliicoccaceae archaeon]
MTSGKAVISGGAGFIGSHLADSLLAEGWEVLAIDRQATPLFTPNINHLKNNIKFSYIQTDIKDPAPFEKLTKGADMIFHLAANSDIKLGGEHPNIDFHDTFLTTISMLKAAKTNGIKKFFFSSTSAVYGDMKGKLNENTGGLQPISYYGGTKLASEAMISAYSYMNDIDALVFRFPNVVGPRLTHGVIFDFIKKLKADPKRLRSLETENKRSSTSTLRISLRGLFNSPPRWKKATIFTTYQRILSHRWIR